MDTMENIKVKVSHAKQHVERLNEILVELMELGVSVDLETTSLRKGVVGIGAVETHKLHASFSIEL